MSNGPAESPSEPKLNQTAISVLECVQYFYLEKQDLHMLFSTTQDLQKNKERKNDRLFYWTALRKERSHKIRPPLQNCSSHHQCFCWVFSCVDSIIWDMLTSCHSVKWLNSNKDCYWDAITLGLIHWKAVWDLEGTARTSAAIQHLTTSWACWRQLCCLEPVWLNLFSQFLTCPKNISVCFKRWY